MCTILRTMDFLDWYNQGMGKLVKVIREELEYSISGLRKELKEVLVTKINDEMLNETPSVAKSTTVVQKPFCK